MTPAEFLQAVHLAQKLKDTTRHCYTGGGRHESVADHSWRLALMAFLLRNEFPGADMDRVLRMCVIHDLGEIFTGDIPSFEKTEENEVTEEKLLFDWVASLPAPLNTDMRRLYDEMRQQETDEARIYKCLDNLEAVIQHNESDLSTWTPNEFSLNLTYAEDRVRFSPYLTELRALLRRETEDKIKNDTNAR